MTTATHQCLFCGMYPCRCTPPAGLARPFRMLWEDLPERIPLTCEHQFALPQRRWRFDFAHMASRVAIELEGISPRGRSRHRSLKGFQGDCEKYNAAGLAGWLVLRYTTFDLERKPAPMLREIVAAINSRGKRAYQLP